MNEDYGEGGYKPTSGGGADRELPKEGLHQGVCCGYVNVGHQEYRGTVSLSPQVYLLFELDQKFTKGDQVGKPMITWEKFAFHLSLPGAKKKSNLTKRLEGWKYDPARPGANVMTEDQVKAFHLGKLIGAPATVNIGYSPREGGGFYANVVGVSRRDPSLPKVEHTYKEVPPYLKGIKEKAVAPPGVPEAERRDAGGSNVPGASERVPPPPPEDDLPF